MVTTLMSKLVNKFLPEPIVEPKAKASAPQAAGNNDELLAVLSAAVHKYRK
ncbi:MAG: OadG family transporter subunit [Marinobacterium sp.]